eukprot:6468850-Amphidinium_carterae.2
MDFDSIFECLIGLKLVSGFEFLELLHHFWKMNALLLLVHTDSVGVVTVQDAVVHRMSEARLLCILQALWLEFLSK